MFTPTALQTVRKAMTHIYYGVENEGLRLSLWAARAGSSFSTPKSAVTVRILAQNRQNGCGKKTIYPN